MPRFPDAASVSRRLRGAVAASCVCAALALAAWFANRPEKLETPRDASEEPVIEAENARSIVVRENGQKVWEFSARHIQVEAGQMFATAQDVSRGVLWSNGAPLWKLKAQHVQLNQRTRDVDASGAIQADGPHSLQVRTRHAIWTHRAATLTCPERIDATLPNVRIQSGAASYEAKSDTLRCLNDVSVESRAASLWSPRAVAHPKTQSIEFQGGVDIVIHTRQVSQLEDARLRMLR